MNPGFMQSRFLVAACSAALLVGCSDPADPNGQDTTTIALSAPASFLAVSDTLRLQATALNSTGQAITTATITYTTSAPAIATVESDGRVVGRAVGEATITAAFRDASAQVLISVDPDPCAGGALSLPVGGVRSYRGARAFTCITLASAVAPQDYLFVVGNARAVQDDTLTFRVGVSAAPVALFADAGRRTFEDPRDALARQEMELPNAVENRLRRFEREQVARALPNVQRNALNPAAALSISAAQFALMAVGDTVNIRVPNLAPSANICRDFIPIRAVTRVVSGRAVILEDIASPPGKLTTSDYQGIASEFDNIIYPTDTLWFGSPTDINSDQRVTIVYTPEVNKLTPANSNGIVGGFFFGGDLIRRTEYPTNSDCRAQTNEQEIFYIIAPDPNGVVNGNRRTTAGVRQVTRGTIAHEFQHMINQSVRQYNPLVKAFETPWLNEAMAHFAEEAVGRVVRGFGESESLTEAMINPSTTDQNDYTAFFRQNQTRFRFWALRPDTASPTSVRARNELASRGAAWALVRYAADHYGNGNPRSFFRRLAAGPETDITNMVARAGNRPFDEIIGGWLIANYADGLNIPGLSTLYSYPTWDMRNVLSAVNNNTYPLLVNTLPGPFTSQAFSGSGGYYLLRRPASAAATSFNLTTASGAAMTSQSARVWVVRLN